MAIKINNTTIIDDSRNIVNAGVVTATGFVGDVTGNATGLSGSPNVTVGVLTATSFVGDGSQLQGVQSAAKTFFISARR
jgi:hypothetical protein